MEPVSATPKWRQPSVTEECVVTIKGGYNTKGDSCQGVRHEMDGEVHLFLILDKNNPWFTKAVAGKLKETRYLKQVTILSLLRRHFQKALGLDPDEESAVADRAAAEQTAVAEQAAAGDSQNITEDDDIDLMDSLDAVEDVLPQQKERTKPARRNKPKKPKEDKPIMQGPMCLPVTVPLRPPCACRDERATTAVWLYQAAKTNLNGGPAKLYLREDSLPWLLAYAADEFHFQRIVAAPLGPEEDKKANCREVEDLSVEWEFDAATWVGHFVDGPAKGQERRLPVLSLTKHMWDTLQERSMVMGPWSSATKAFKRDAARQLLVLWCAAIAGNDADEFEQSMGLGTVVAAVPPQAASRKRKTAVAGMQLDNWDLHSATGRKRLLRPRVDDDDTEVGDLDDGYDMEVTDLDDGGDSRGSQKD